MSRLLKSNVFYLSVVLQLFSVFDFFISLFVVIIARQRMRVRFCTRKVPGRWSLHSFFDDWSHFQKKGTYTGFTNDNKTITKTTTFGIKNGPCDTTRPFSSPFPLLFPFPSFSFSFPFFLLSFFFPFSFPIRSYFFPFLFLSFSFPCPFSFLFLSLSVSSPFPILSFPFLTLPFPSPFPRSCESFGQGVKPALGKTIREKKRITCGKTIWKGSGFLQDPTWATAKIYRNGK